MKTVQTTHYEYYEKRNQALLDIQAKLIEVAMDLEERVQRDRSYAQYEALLISNEEDLLDEVVECREIVNNLKEAVKRTVSAQQKLESFLASDF